MTSRPVGQVRSSEQKRRLAAVRTKLTKVKCRSSLLHRLAHYPRGTDHQRIVKLDRDNEVAPPSKVAPSVGRVRVLFCHLGRPSPDLTLYAYAGDANRAYGTEALSEGRRSKNKREAVGAARLRIGQSDPQSADPLQA